jgi:pimeloyl-ACP methyl ester carboxylesterase
LWGTSFSGGHVEVAATDRRVAAAVAQCPFLDGVAALGLVPARNLLRMTLAGIEDELRGLLGRGPRYLPVVGPPGSLAAMTTPDAAPGYLAMVPPGSRWRNALAARLALRVAGYRPVRAASRVRCPLLVCVCDHDRVTPPAPASRAAGATPRGEIRRYPLGHFDIYFGEAFERAVADQTEFLARHLLGAAVEAPVASAR